MTDPDTKGLQELLDAGKMSGWEVLEAIYVQRFSDGFFNADGSRIKPSIMPPTDGNTPWLTDKDVRHLIGDAVCACLMDVEKGVETIGRLVAVIGRLVGAVL